MILYLSGPITGDPDYVDKFFSAELALYSMKHVVLNPACLPKGLKEHDDYMRIGLAMLEVADGIVMLPGWKKSAGARMELREALISGKKVFFGIDDTLRRT